MIQAVRRVIEVLFVTKCFVIVVTDRVCKYLPHREGPVLYDGKQHQPTENGIGAFDGVEYISIRIIFCWQIGHPRLEDAETSFSSKSFQKKDDVLMLRLEEFYIAWHASKYAERKEVFEIFINIQPRMFSLSLQRINTAFCTSEWYFTFPVENFSDRWDDKSFQSYFHDLEYKIC